MFFTTMKDEIADMITIPKEKISVRLILVMLVSLDYECSIMIPG